jgi:hypothetical protein
MFYHNFSVLTPFSLILTLTRPLRRIQQLYSDVLLCLYCLVCCFLFIVFFICMYLCVTIDGAQFEGPQEQGFEDVPEQQQIFDEGKWSLIIFQSQ